MISRPDLLDDRSPAGLEVIQLTTEAEVPSSHIYMEAQIFTPDSRHFILHRSAHPHGSDKNDPEHRYLLCDVATGELMPMTDETGVTAPSISPDGRYFYYLVDETDPAGGRLTFKRRNIDGSDPETITVIDKFLPGTSFRPSLMYPLSTIRSDGQRFAASCFLGDGATPGSPFGLLVFDIPSATVSVVVHGPSWCNMHPQYSRSLDPVQMRDILLQENHGNVCDENGKYLTLVSQLGCDIHVVRDDGLNFRDMPWGRDGNEFCQGHQCWRGRSVWAITSTSTMDVKECQLIEAKAVPHIDHNGRRVPDAQRNDLSREFNKPDFYHFATDIEGTRFVTDCGPGGIDGSIYYAALGEAGSEPLQNMTYLCSPRSTWLKGAHVHPFLSPDGRLAFFNSDESGILQSYMIRGLPEF